MLIGKYTENSNEEKTKMGFLQSICGIATQTLMMNPATSPKEVMAQVSELYVRKLPQKYQCVFYPAFNTVVHVTTECIRERLFSKN